MRCYISIRNVSNKITCMTLYKNNDETNKFIKTNRNKNYMYVDNKQYNKYYECNVFLSNVMYFMKYF